MQLSPCVSNQLARLCVRISSVETQLGIPPSNSRTNKPPFPFKTSPSNQISILCQRIKRLEALVVIPAVITTTPYKPLGPNGNAVLSNKVNLLCGRLARIQRNI